MIRLKNKLRFFSFLFVVVFAFLLFAYFNFFDFVLKQFYPVMYSDEVCKYSDMFGVDKYWIYSIIKNESGFDKYATSDKSAMGLMQVTDDTGLWIAENLDIKGFNANNLYSSDLNIKFGTWYFKYLFEMYGDVDVALAAYNAGCGNVDKWLENKEYSVDGKFLSDIPYKETKKYVKNVKETYGKYVSLYENL